MLRQEGPRLRTGGYALWNTEGWPVTRRCCARWAPRARRTPRAARNDAVQSSPRGIQLHSTIAGVALAAAFFMLFELSYEVIYDLRDVAGDRVAGARTFPVVHGEGVAVWIIDALHLAALAVLVGGWAGGVVPWRLVVFSLAPALQLFLYKRALRRGLTSADCTGLTWLGAALLAATGAAAVDAGDLDILRVLAVAAVERAVLTAC